MDKNYLIKLTSNLYRLTLLFPRKEPLRYKMRELAGEILAGSFSNPKIKKETFEKLDILDSFFAVAGNQNWVSPQDILNLQQEYIRVKEVFNKFSQSQKAENLFKQRSSIGQNYEDGPRNGRQQRILEILKEKGKVQVWEIKKVFPEVTKRTLRRDFEEMLNQGLIERMGERNNTFYQLKGRTYNI